MSIEQLPGEPSHEDLEAKIKALEAENAELRHELTHDYKTGILNERGFDEAFEKVLGEPLPRLEHGPEKERRHELSDKSCLLLFDLDGMKEANDLYGHDVGDKVLKAVAEYWRKHSRPTDLVARLHGDEFAILFRGAPAEEIMKKFETEIAGAKRSVINFPVKIEDDTEDIMTASGGIVDVNSGHSLETLKKMADDALYLSKQAGRDRITLYRESPQ